MAKLFFLALLCVASSAVEGVRLNLHSRSQALRGHTKLHAASELGTGKTAAERKEAEDKEKEILNEDFTAAQQQVQLLDADEQDQLSREMRTESSASVTSIVDSIVIMLPFVDDSIEELERIDELEAEDDVEDGVDPTDPKDVINQMRDQFMDTFASRRPEVSDNVQEALQNEADQQNAFHERMIADGKIPSFTVETLFNGLLESFFLEGLIEDESNGDFFDNVGTVLAENHQTAEGLSESVRKGQSVAEVANRMNAEFAQDMVQSFADHTIQAMMEGLNDPAVKSSEDIIDKLKDANLGSLENLKNIDRIARDGPQIMDALEDQELAGGNIDLAIAEVQGANAGMAEKARCCDPPFCAIGCSCCDSALRAALYFS